jgi:hypothetical protein
MEIPECSASPCERSAVLCVQYLGLSGALPFEPQSRQSRPKKRLYGPLGHHAKHRIIFRWYDLLFSRCSCCHLDPESTIALNRGNQVLLFMLA